MDTAEEGESFFQKGVTTGRIIMLQWVDHTQVHMDDTQRTWWVIKKDGSGKENMGSIWGELKGELRVDI